MTEVAGQPFLRQGRAGVRQMVLVADHDDVSGEPGRPKLLGGPKSAEAATDDNDTLGHAQVTPRQ